MPHESSIKTVAFVGLGTMGFPMAGHLAKAGYAVRVYNRHPDKAQRWAEQYVGTVCSSPKEAAQGSQCVMMCVGNDDDVRSVVYGDDGILAGLEAGGVLVDHTTTSALLAQELAQACETRGIQFVDAPVSGGQSGAEKGVLTVLCGGNETVVDRILGVLQAYSEAINYFGPAGYGQRAKMVNQICIAGLVQALSEAIAFGMNAQLPMEKVMPALGLGAAGSWQMLNRSSTMMKGEFDFGFAVDWMRKDLGIALEEAKRNGSSLPVTAIVDQLYAQVQADGHGRWDTSSLITRLPHPKEDAKS